MPRPCLQIELDPCSEAEAQQVVQAQRIITASTDGLSQWWLGKAFLNPPYGLRGNQSLQGLFLAYAIKEYEAGRLTEAIILLKSSVGYDWLAPAFQHPHGLLKQRVAFTAGSEGNAADGSSGNPHGSVVVYLGPNAARFCQVFSTVAFIAKVNAWPFV